MGQSEAFFSHCHVNKQGGNTAVKAPFFSHFHQYIHTMARNQSSSSPKAPRNVKKHEKAKQIKRESTLLVSNNNDHSLFSVEEKCDLIAQLSESVLEDPSTAFFSTQEHDSEEKIPSKVSQLLALARQQDSANNEYVARLACISLLALFQDVLPSYRIRLPTAAEMAVRVSKETKQLWDYERALLSHYQLYLKLLEQTFDKHKKSTTISTLQTTAILSLCELCKSSFSFNFGNNILKCVVRQMNLKKCEEIRTAACRAIAHVFQHDAQGTCALEATRLVAKMVKDVDYRVVDPQVLQTFTSLPLRIHLDEAEAAKLAAAANAKKRKRNKQEAEIESELKEASSSVDKIILARAQSDTLQAVTLTYFAILKSERLHTDVYMRQLLPTVLEGLAKFAHFIHFDTVLDLLQVFQTLLQRVDELSLEASLQCILTAFSTLQGPGRELKIDQKEYITPLYSQLPR
jgi:nucleolar complex protein 3